MKCKIGIFNGKAITLENFRQLRSFGLQGWQI